jgi:hypothetical protein
LAPNGVSVGHFAGLSSDATHIVIGARRKGMSGNLVKVSTDVTGATFGSPFMIPPNAP